MSFFKLMSFLLKNVFFQIILFFLLEPIFESVQNYAKKS